MRKAKFKDHTKDWHQYDVNRLVEIARKAGIEVSHADAKLAWEAYSDSMAAGWMMLDDDDSINLANMMIFLEVED